MSRASQFSGGLRDKEGPYAVDGRCIANQGDVSVDDADPSKLSIGGGSVHQNAVFAGFRGSKYQATFDFTWAKNPNDPNQQITPGAVVHWQDPSNFMMVRIRTANSHVQLWRVQDGHLTYVTSGSVAAGLTHNTIYSAKVLIRP